MRGELFGLTDRDQALGARQGRLVAVGVGVEVERHVADRHDGSQVDRLPLLAEAFAEQEPGDDRRVAPEHAFQAGLGREFLEFEGIDRVGLLAVGHAQHETRHRQAQVGRLGKLLERAPGILDQGMEVVEFQVQAVGAERGDEGPFALGRDLGDAAEKIGVRRGHLEGVVGDHDGQRPLMGIERRLLDQELEEARVFQGVRGTQVGGDLFRGDIVKHDLEMAGGFQAPDQKVDRAPKRLQGLEVRVMQDRAHGHRERLVHGRHHGVLARVLFRNHVRADDLLEQLVDRGFLPRRRGRAADEFGEITQLAIDRDHGAARLVALFLFLLAAFRAPGHELLGRAVEGRGVVQALAQTGQLAEDVQIVVQLVGMEIVDAGQGDLDRGALRADRQDELDALALDHVVQVVDVDFHRLAARQIGAGLQLAPVGARRKVAEHGDPERRGAGTRLVGDFPAHGAEVDLVLHGTNPQ